MTNIKNNKITITIIVFVSFIIILSIAYLMYILQNTKNSDMTKDPSYAVTYIDPGSGATIVIKPNLGPEKGMNNINTTVTGLGRFTEIGLQKTQRDKLWNYFINYASSQKISIKEISVTVASIKKINTESDGSNSIDFEITTDRVTKLSAKITYSGIDNLNLNIFNNNQPIYTSK